MAHTPNGWGIRLHQGRGKPGLTSLTFPCRSFDIVRVCVVSVTVLEVHVRKRWPSWWHLHALWSRFLSRSLVHETQHVHDSRMLMIRWCFAGTYSPTSGATACTHCEAGKFKAAAGVNTACDNCEAGKYQATAGDESVCVRGREEEGGKANTL